MQGVKLLEHGKFECVQIGVTGEEKTMLLQCRFAHCNGMVI